MDNTLFDYVSASVRACTAVTAFIGTGDGRALFEYFRRPNVGFEDHHNILEYFTDLGVPPGERFGDACALYEDVKIASIAPSPSINDLVARLSARSNGLAVGTDAKRLNAARRLARVGLLHAFDCVVTPDESGRPKPAPDSFLLALERLGAAAGDAVMVGDSLRRDISPAKAIGIRTVYAAYGDPVYVGGSPPAADHVALAPDDLLLLLDGSAER
jgi:putative hydrolase of the HAD superfamily